MNPVVEGFTMRHLLFLFLVASCSTRDLPSGEGTETGSSSGESSSSTSGVQTSTSQETTGQSETTGTSSTGDLTSEEPHTSEGGSSETTLEPSVCGDGIVEGSEECEGDVGCLPNCTWKVRYIFLSPPVQGDLQGVEVASELCETWACDNPKLCGGIYAALIQDSLFGFWEPLGDFDGLYRLPSGVPVGRLTDLRKGPLWNPIDQDVSGTSVSPEVKAWTGFDPDGVLDWTCKEWLSLDHEGRVGQIGALNTSWFHNNEVMPCHAILRYYCIQTE